MSHERSVRVAWNVVMRRFYFARTVASYNISTPARTVCRFFFALCMVRTTRECHGAGVVLHAAPAGAEADPGGVLRQRSGPVILLPLTSCCRESSYVENLSSRATFHFSEIFTKLNNRLSKFPGYQHRDRAVGSRKHGGRRMRTSEQRSCTGVQLFAFLPFRSSLFNVGSVYNSTRC